MIPRWRTVNSGDNDPRTIMLSHMLHDDYRIVVVDEDNGEVDAMRVYPCGVCGYQDDCEYGCHT